MSCRNEARTGGTDEARAVQLAVVEDEAQEAQEVSGRAVEGVAHVVKLRSRRWRVLNAREAAGLGLQGDVGDPVADLVPLENRAAHAERLKDLLGHELLDGPAVHRGDDVANPVGADPVGEALTGIEEERVLQRLPQSGQVSWCTGLCGVRQHERGEDVVALPLGMRQQVAERGPGSRVAEDRAVRCHGLEDLELVERREDVAHRGVHGEDSTVDRDQRGHTPDRLGGREQAADGVRIGLAVGRGSAGAALPADSATVRDGRAQEGSHAVVDGLANDLIEAVHVNPSPHAFIAVARRRAGGHLLGLPAIDPSSPSVQRKVDVFAHRLGRLRGELRAVGGIAFHAKRSVHIEITTAVDSGLGHRDRDARQGRELAGEAEGRLLRIARRA